MADTVVFPGPVSLRAAGQHNQIALSPPDWGVYADPCWTGWPGEVLDWPDFGLPRDDRRALSAIIEALARARAGQDVLVGCHGGIGRTGTILAAMAVASGVPPEGARAWVRRRHHPKSVETDAQHDWVKTRVASDKRIAHLADKVRRARVDAVRGRLRSEMSSALDAGDPLPRLAWAIPDLLAVTQRPLRAHPFYKGSGRDYPREARPDIDTWITDLVHQGLRSVIVLTSERELRHYDRPTDSDGGLLSLYKAAGLSVEHLPADDPAHDVTARAAFDDAVDRLSTDIVGTLRALPQPAVLHCSAAIDRSPPVAARIAFLPRSTVYRLAPSRRWAPGFRC